MWEKGKEGKWRGNKSPGGVKRPPESKTAFHATTCACMSGHLAWKPRKGHPPEQLLLRGPRRNVNKMRVGGASSTTTACSSSSSSTTPSHRHFHLHSYLHHHKPLSSS